MRGGGADRRAGRFTIDVGVLRRYGKSETSKIAGKPPLSSFRKRNVNRNTEIVSCSN